MMLHDQNTLFNEAKLQSENTGMKIGKVKHRYCLAAQPNTKSSRLPPSGEHNMESNLLTRAQSCLLTMLRTHRLSRRQSVN